MVPFVLFNGCKGIEILIYSKCFLKKNIEKNAFEENERIRDTFLEKKFRKYLPVQKMLYLCSRNQKRDVAQLASAPRSGRGGRKFESSHPDYNKEVIQQ